MKSFNNVIKEKKPPSVLHTALSQLTSPLIYVLLGAAAVTWYLHDAIDTIVIVTAVLINTVLGFVQEHKAERGLAALKKILTPTAKKRTRDGAIETIDARTIEVGDVIALTAGDRIPADGTLTEAVHCFTNEAILTGESTLVEKVVGFDDQVFAGTILASGRAVCTVTHIGMDTKLGAIAEKLETTEEEDTPLQRQLAVLAKNLAILVVVICLTIFVIGIIRGQPIIAMFTLAVAIAVAAIPEGMVVSLTVILSVGMQRILKKNAIVRRLVSAETLGSVSVLCIDKTGTLTEGVMRVAGTTITHKERALNTCVFANNLANPIDIALWEWAQSQDHFDPQEVSDSQQRTSEIPFDGARKYMLVKNALGIWVKGAPEILLTHCRLTPKEHAHWEKEVDTFARKGLRVIGLAWKKAGSVSHAHPLPDGLQFIGILGVSDPVREGVKEALAVAASAGVSVKIVTGDYRLTSETIMQSLGMPISDPENEIMEGSELTDISVEELSQKVKSVKLFCRVTPEDKLKVVTALQNTGEVVGMTGDGVNDSLALKKADIGIVVATASDVAKDISDIVLLDSNFRTIVAAIEEGRALFHNIRKIVLYLLADAFTEILLITASLLLFIPVPLTAIQILWINILTDGFPNLALSQEPKEFDVMRHKPRTKASSILDTRIRVLIAAISGTKAVTALTVFLWALTTTADVLYAQTLTFAVVGSGSLMYIFSTRNLSKTIFETNPIKNLWLVGAVGIGFLLQFLIIYHPALRQAFSLHPLAVMDWLIVLGSGLALLAVSELTKSLLRRRDLLLP